MGDRALAEHYEIRFVLGFGSFGTVYQARQISTGQLVAVKILHPASSDAAKEQRIARFRREMAICAELHHPNIVRFIDSGVTDTGEPYAVFEFLPGKTLAEVLSEHGPLDPVESRHLMLQVLDGLSCAHAQGVVHRDIKPSNVMVVASGGRRNAVILDFGIGGYCDDDQIRMTATGDWLGSASYSAPEQIAGHAPTPRSDLYSWGLMFVECMTGQPVMRGFTLATTLWQHLSTDTVPVPWKIRESGLGRLLDRVLVKDVERRTIAAPDLLRGLESCGLEDLARQLQRHTPVPDANAGAHPPAADVRSSDEMSTGGDDPRDRPFTAVCCDVSLSTQPVDRDMLARIAAALHDRARVIARRFEGQLVGNVGTGERIELQFGVAVAREDDVRRAARAALQLVTSFQGRATLVDAEHGVRLEVRAGIHTAGVAGAARTRAVAADLCTRAAGGQVIVSDAVREQVWGQFACRPVGSFDTAAGSLLAFVIDAEIASQRADSTPRGRVPMVGRQHELALLRQRWQATREGDGRVVLVSGEAGIGKSRLLAELGAALEGEPHQRLICRCTPESQTSALAPLVELLDSLLRSSRDGEPHMDAVGRAAALVVLLTRHGLPLEDTYPVLAELLSLAHDPRYPLPAVSPQRQKDNTLNALVSLLGEIAERQPLLFVIEDLHWADPTTHELVAALVRDPPRRMLGVWSSRPELAATWAGPALLQIHLGSLSRDDSHALAVALVGEHSLGAGALQALVERSDGVPLFMEEMAVMVSEAGGAPAAAVPDSAGLQAIPSTLRGMLGARLDRLGRARETAQLAAAIGREFGAELLLTASALDADAVHDDLERLISADLIHRRRRLRNATFQFKHALVRDAVYDSCSDARRQSIHGRIAGALEARFPEIVQSRPDLLAHHHAAAEQKRQAIGYAQRAAEQGLARSTYGEVIAHASSAVTWAQTLPDADAIEVELLANGALIQALMATRGWADSQVKATVDRSADLLQQLGPDNVHRVPTLWFLFVHHHVASNRRTARQIAEELVASTAHAADPGIRAAAATFHGLALFFDGDHADATRDLERAIELYDPDLHRDHGPRFGLDSLVMAKSFMAMLYWFSGDTAGAIELVTSAVAWAREVDHVPSIALGLLYAGFVYQLDGDRRTTAAMTEEILALSGKYGLPAYEGYAATLHDWATGDTQRARAIVSGLAGLGCRIALSYYGSLAADSDVVQGDIGSAIACIDECLSMCRENDEHFYEPELHRRRAMYEAQRSPASESIKASLERAAELAQRHDMPRVETLARAELLRRFGSTESHQARLEQLFALRPGLRDIETDHHKGAAQ